MVSNSSPATDVTGIVNSKCFYLIWFFSLIKVTKIYTKPRMGLQEKDPKKQLLTNGRSLGEETAMPAKLAGKQKALFAAVSVPSNTVPADVWLHFLVKVLKCTSKKSKLMV